MRLRPLKLSAIALSSVLLVASTSTSVLANNRPDGAGKAPAATAIESDSPGNSAKSNRPVDPGTTPADRTPGSTPDTRPVEPAANDNKGNSASNSSGDAGGSSSGSTTGNASGNSSSNGAATPPAAATSSDKGPSATNKGAATQGSVMRATVNPVAASNSAARALASTAATSADEDELELAQRSARIACLSEVLGEENRSTKTLTRKVPAVKNLTPASVRKAEQECDEEIGDKGRYLVKFTPGSNASDVAKAAREKSAIRTENKFAVDRVFTDVFPGMAITAGSAQITALRKNPNVDVIEPDGFVLTTDTQSPAPWGLDRIDQRTLPLNTSYSYATTGSGVNVYVIDTGVRTDHVDFGGRVKAGFAAIDDGRGTQDCNGHGTHVAGTIAGATYGAAKSASIIPVRVLDCYGSGTWSGVIAGLDWVAKNHAAGVPAVANMSLGGGASTLVDDAVRAVIADGVTTVVAAGNSSTDACTTSPARVGQAITVAASDAQDSQASFTNVGSCVDLFAPGVGIASDWYTSSTATATLSGTSMASPHVAGAVALIGAANPDTSWNTLRSAATSGVLMGVSAGTPNLLLYVGSTDPEVPVEDTPTDETPSEATVPDAPVAPEAQGGSRSATVTWALPADGGSALTSQTVWIYNARGRLAGTVSVSGTTTAVTVTGLAPRKAYSFAVSAANVVGSGAQSPRSATIITSR